jgi:hypothetical protein
MNSFRLVTVPNPGAQTEFSYIQPPNLYSKLRIVRFLFTAAVVVGARTISISLIDPTLVHFIAFLPFAQACNSGEVRTYLGVDKWTQTEVAFAIAGANYVHHECANFVLMPGMHIDSETINFKAADTITNIRLLFEDLNVEATGAVG